MAKNKIDLGCAQTRGTFQLSGKVTGVMSNNFYSEGDTKNGGSYRRVHFGVEVEEGKIVYVDLFGSTVDQVYFSKTVKDGNGKNKTTTNAVKWADRFKTSKQLFGEDGFRLIGVTCGCKKVMDSKGREVNDKKYLTSFDACDEVQNLNDGDDVFIKGNIVYSTYNGQHRVSFEPTQISLCKEIDFSDINFKPNAQFTQNIVCMNVAKNDEVPGEFVVTAKIVNYSSVEETELYTKDVALAKNIKKLGEYCFLKVWGDISVEGATEEVETENTGWGSSNRMERVTSPFKRKLVITGADPDTIDKESYSEEIIEHALEVVAGIQSAKNDYGMKDEKSEGWGNKRGGNGLDDDDEEDFDLGI